MADFSIQFSDEEIKMLLKHVFIGNWVLTATQEETNKNIDNFNQKILKVLKNSAIGTKIEKDKKSNQYFVEQKVESEYIEEIENYNEDTFFEELIDRLTKRDIGKLYTAEDLQKLNEVKFNALFDKVQDKYINEIETNGIEFIGIIKQEKE